MPTTSPNFSIATAWPSAPAITARCRCTSGWELTASARASFYLYNTLAEIDTLGEALVQAKTTLRRK